MSWAVLGLEWEPEEAWGRPWEENIGRPKENHRFWGAQGARDDIGPAECARPVFLRKPCGGWQLFRRFGI